MLGARTSLAVEVTAAEAGDSAVRVTSAAAAVRVAVAATHSPSARAVGLSLRSLGLSTHRGKSEISGHVPENRGGDDGGGDDDDDVRSWRRGRSPR
jgi:hypothetical protein